MPLGFSRDNNAEERGRAEERERRGGGKRCLVLSALHIDQIGLLQASLVTPK